MDGPALHRGVAGIAFPKGRNGPFDKKSIRGAAIMADKVVPVSRLLDERGLSAFQIKLIVWSFFIVLIDGYDIAAIAFAAPYLIKDWGVPPPELRWALSASLVGILFGSALFGWVGDRYGRKAALISSNLLFGVFT